MRTIFLVCALLLGVASGASITSIVIDPNGESVYISTNDKPDPVLYVLDNAALQVVDSHYLPKSVAPDGLYARQGKRELLAFVGKDSTDLQKFKLPLSNKDTLPIKDKNSISKTDVWINPVFDEEDEIIIVTTGKDVSIVDMNSLKVLDKIAVFPDKSRSGYDNTIYNHNTNRLIVFWSTRTSPRGGHDVVYVREFDLTSKKFKELKTTYNCSCNSTSDTSGPFYNVALQACELDYSRNQIWCFREVYDQLFVFNASDLSQYEIRQWNRSVLDILGFYTVKFDFINRKLYAVQLKYYNHTNYFVGKYDLDTLELVALVTSPGDINSRNYHIALDRQQHYLYLAVENYQTYPPGTSSDFFNASVVIVNTDSMTAQSVLLDRAVGVV